MNKLYKKSKFNLVYNNNDNNIIFNTITGALIVLSNREYQRYNAIIDNKILNIEDELFFALYTEKFIIDSEFNELDKLRYDINSNRFSQDVLDITIAPTMACNFKCPYCYEQKGRTLNTKSMSKLIQDSLINFIKLRLDKSCSKKLYINWYGGEPLLEIDLIKKLTKIFLDICNKKQIAYEATMITNGYLLNKISINEIKDLAISTLQITIDGPKRVHDNIRVLHNNSPTYNRILNNAIRLQHDVFITIRVNIDKNNLDYITELKTDLEKKD